MSVLVLSTVTFGILTNIPKRALIATGIAGTVGWMIYWRCMKWVMALVVPIFMLPLQLAVSASFFTTQENAHDHLQYS